MIAGIESLGEGLLKGYQFGLQQQRQRAQDARQAELDAQNQEQHELSMELNRFNLDKAKQQQTLDEETQARKLNFNKTLQQAVLMNKSGNKQGAFAALVQGNNNDPQATHNIEFLGMGDDGLGGVRYIDKATGKPAGEGRLSVEDATLMFHQALDPTKSYADEQAKKDKEKEAAEKLAGELKKQQLDNDGKADVARINARASAADNATLLKNTDMQLKAGKYAPDDGKAGKNPFGAAYIFQQAEGTLTRAESDLWVTQMQHQVNTVQVSDNPQARQQAFTTLLGQAKAFAGQVLPRATVAEQEQYAKNLVARQFGDGTYAYEDLEKAVFKKPPPKPAPKNPVPKNPAMPLAAVNRAVTPSPTKPVPQPQPTTILSNGLVNDPKTKQFLFGH